MIAFPIIKLKEFDHIEQQEKIQEELNEVIIELPKSQERLCELLDVIQACITDITHEYTDAEIKQACKWHYQKLVNRKHNIIAELCIEKLNLNE